jgi:uncharacterized membrane protein
MTPPDIAALLFFAICWLLYAPLIKRLGRRGGYINSDMTEVRRRWMANMAVRDNRFLDSQLLGHAINSASFFASSNLIVIAAIGGALFSGQNAFRTIEQLGVVAEAPDWLFTAKLALVVIVLARGFLDFIWALRQMNYTLAGIGAAPPPGTPPETLQAYGEAVSQIINPALSAFNTGVRGYYFALAAAAWLMGPLPFACVTAGAVVLLVLRQSGSASAKGIRNLRTIIDGLPPPAPSPPGAAGSPETGEAPRPPA